MQPDYLNTVMPAVYVQADAAWIQAQMAKLSPMTRQRIALIYGEVFQAAFEAEPVPWRQENRARREANTRLRLFVERYHRAAMGLTDKPPLASARAQTGIAGGPADVQQAGEGL